MWLGERHRVPEIAFRFGRPLHRRRGLADFQIGVVFDRRGRPLWIIATVGVAGRAHAPPCPAIRRWIAASASVGWYLPGKRNACSAVFATPAAFSAGSFS